MNKPTLNDSVIGGDFHNGDVINNYYINKDKPIPNKVKKKRPKRKGTWGKLYLLGLLDFVKVLLVCFVVLSGTFLLLILVGVSV
jgi:hypothetical protein